VIDRIDEFDTEEKKVLREALSDCEPRFGPSDEYVAQLRRRLLSAATPAPAVRRRPSRRALLGSMFGAGIAAILLVAAWFSNTEPAWASAIRMAREQAWIHARFERDGVLNGELWVSPERDVMAMKDGEMVLFLDYRRQSFLRYDVRQRVSYRASKPENPRLPQDLISVTALASMFRRSPTVAPLLGGQPVERWSSQSVVVDGLVLDEYRIVVGHPDQDRAPTTLLLTVDRGQFLPRTLTFEDPPHTLVCHFDYPVAGPSDEHSLGVPHEARIVETDKGDQLAPVAESLREGRQEFDDYTALCVTSSIEKPRPLAFCDVKRVLRRANKWRVDYTQMVSARFVLPRSQDQALAAWRANRDQFRFVPLVICDGSMIRVYRPQLKAGFDKTPSGPPAISQAVPLKDDSQADSFMSAIFIPERSCRPIFFLSSFDQSVEVASESKDRPEALIKVDVLPARRTPNRNDGAMTYWLNPALGNAAVRIVSHPRDSKLRASLSSQPSQEEATLEDFRQSPHGLWYPTVVSRKISGQPNKQTTRFYVDFTDVPSDELFAPAERAP
jgi:hypothetical protein